MKISNSLRSLAAAAFLITSASVTAQPIGGAGAPGPGGRGIGGGLPNATPAQQTAITAMDTALATNVTAANEARLALVAASFAQPRNTAEIATKTAALSTAELTLAIARATEFNKLQAGADKLTLEQVSALVAQGLRGGGARRGGGPATTGYVYGPDGVWWGLDNTPIIPGLPWRIHDANRPQPPIVKPPAKPGGPPSDAIVLFDGTDLSRWGVRNQAGEYVTPNWPIANGVMTAGPGTLTTRESYGDVQLHVEFAMPTQDTGTSQSRGNSGLNFMGRYEFQILDSYNNRTYADGMNASIYGEWPPMVNIAAPPGEWQTFDIVFEAPRFDGTKVLAPAYVTAFWNGAMVHNRQAVAGGTSAIMTPHQYTPHAAELPMSIQGRAPVQFRNIWIRRIKGYDQPAG